MRLPIRFYQLGRKFVFYHRLLVELLEQAKGSLTQLNRFGRVLDNLRQHELDSTKALCPASPCSVWH